MANLIANDYISYEIYTSGGTFYIDPEASTVNYPAAPSARVIIYKIA